jgi:V/A-type H+-transporting ATPase subunit I
LYKEIDPTTILFFTFSLFFGFMLGDVGYGTILVLLGFFLKKKPVFGIGGKEVGNVIVIAGISSIIFGIIIFAEAFGLHFAPHSPHHHSLYWTDLLGIHGVYFSYTFLGVEFPLSKLDVEDIALLLILTPILGVVHMSFGLLLGFRNEAIMHGLKKAVTVKIGWLLLFLCMLSLLLLIPKLGLSAIIGSLLSLMEGKFPSFSFPGILFYILLAMALSAIILLFMGEGMSALFELPSVLANSLSYTRLAAVAIAKAGMAFSANMMIFELGGPAFLITGFFIHAMVPLLGLIACGLQSIRLQYYEFFHKFYEGGGPEFVPFGRERRLSYE